MGRYAQTADVRRRLPYRTIDATTAPALDDVDRWILEGEALLEGALIAAGIATPLTLARGLRQALVWVSDYAEGRYRRALAASGGDGSNEDGADLLRTFAERLTDIEANPARYSAMLLGSGVEVKAEASRTRGTASADRTDPVFTKGGGGDQW